MGLVGYRTIARGRSASEGIERPVGSPFHYAIAGCYRVGRQRTSLENAEIWLASKSLGLTCSCGIESAIAYRL